MPLTYKLQNHSYEPFSVAQHASSMSSSTNIVENLQHFHNINLFHRFFSASYFEMHCLVLIRSNFVSSYRKPYRLFLELPKAVSMINCIFFYLPYNAYHKIVVQSRAASLGYHQSLWTITPDFLQQGLLWNCWRFQICYACPHSYKENGLKAVT